MAPPPTLAPSTPAPAADDPRILLRAKGDAWVQVRDKTGQILLNRTMHAGDTWQVPGKPVLMLTTGNAGGTELLVDGVLAPPLGAIGAVRRDLVLDPDQVKNGKIAPAPAPSPIQPISAPPSRPSPIASG